MNKTQEQVLALAGLLQAVDLVDQLARTGQADNDSFNTSINSILQQNPDDTASVYGGIHNMQNALKQLNNLLQQRQQKSGGLLIRYALALLHLEKRMTKNQNMSDIIGSRIEQAIRQGQHFDDSVHENVIANLAGIYQDTFSKLNYRIQVMGEANYLQQNHIANKIRALLLAGIRSAVLWRQLGGSRWQLFFKRRALLQEVQHLLKL